MSAETQEIGRLRAWLREIEVIARRAPSNLSQTEILLASVTALRDTYWPEVPMPDKHHRRIAAIK